MTDFTGYQSRTRDIQDGAERGVWGSRTDVAGAGSIMSVRGTGTVDLELPVVNFGYSFNVGDDYNAEVIMISLGSDVNDKVALPVLPRDKQHQWPVNTGGMQHPTNAARRIEFNDTETWLKDGTFVLGDDKPMTITVAGNNVTITMNGDNDVTIAGNSNVTVQGDATLAVTGDASVTATGVAITSSTLTHNGVNVGATHRHTGDSGGTTGTPI